ncbi:pali-domain-containing protein [Plenodomus tracheiphilus IPT5]|uniref:Pali-domain-containing protein n=1 Tax=Plenodomus tracheiphilus IPT5 TaxID=1408161 RepID=A0A6A7BR69_9PLEO|nr:pali-domain-containing protein [Plenodomus tracheiphilus IPT5]
MLRPATPLSILFFVAFCLLLLSTLSTPLIKSIPLATYRGIHFGVLGYCDNGDCKGPMVGYNTESLFQDAPDTDFSLPSAQRHALSSILIVHPVAALMTLICFGLAIAAHFHSPAHSPRYLLALLIFTFPTLLVTLLAFLVDILLFVPHVGWGGWIVLAATIIIVASGIVTCAMRRTLVSRKARKRRIAENDEMNGQSYYANRANPATVTTEFPKAESPPPLSGDTIMSGSKGHDNAYFDSQKPSPSDDMTPLNQRNPSLKTVSSNGEARPDPMAPPMRGPSGRRQPVDQYGNAIPPMPNDPYVMNAAPRGPPGRGGSQRGRGGPPRGGPYGRGRGSGYGPRGGMRGPPPPGWNGGGRGGRGGPMQGPPPNGRGAPPPGYSNNFYGQSMPPPREQSPYGRGPPPPGPMPIGQAIEMDHRTGTPPANFGLRESDGDVAGMLALQQGGFPAGAPQRRVADGVMSPTSEYSIDESRVQQPQRQQQQQHMPSQQQYIPVRAGWNGQKMPSDQNVSTLDNSNRGLSPIQDSPVELPAQLSRVGGPTSNRLERSSDYYEDVDPRFAEPVQAHQLPPMPPSLMPGGFSSSNPNLLTAPNLSDPNLPRNSSYDDLPEGSRSPAASEASHFTSVSQRPVNPNWRPDMGAPAGQFAPYNGNGRRAMRPEEVILQANAENPDFAIPGRGNGRGRGRGGRGGGIAPPVPATMMGQGPGLTNQSRYPGASAM